MNLRSDLLFDALNSALNRIRAELGRDNLSDALIRWLLPGVTQEIHLTADVEHALAKQGASRTHRDVALLGYAIELKIGDPKIIRDRLTEGLNWITGCKLVVDGAPLGIVDDPGAVFGIALGSVHSDDALRSKLVDWFGEVKQVVNSARDPNSWQTRAIIASAALMANEWPDPPLTDSILLSVCLASARQSRRLADEYMSADSVNWLFRELIRLSPQTDETLPLAFLASATQSVLDRVSVSVSVHSPEGVIELLSLCPLSLRHWTWEVNPSKKGATPRKWHVDHERHVQNLVWALLAPHYPDLKWEENTSSVGSLHPRADICIPSLRLVVEIKYADAKHAGKDIIREIAEDSGLYLVPNSRYDSIIAFVWDELSRGEEHVEWRQGLEQLNGVIGAVIVSRPGLMSQED